MSAGAGHKGEFTGRHMLLLTVGFFGVVAAVNVGMAVVSATSWTGLVVKNSYVASQEFETHREAHEAQLAAGWRSDFSHEDGVARLSVVDATGAAIDLGAVRLEINRPVGGHDDQVLELERQPDGSYVTPLTLGAGVWEARFRADETSLGPYELHQRFSTSGAAR